MRHPSPQRAAVALLAAAALLCVFAGSASAQNSDPRVLSPAGLGPSYSGITGSGVGLLSKKPKFGIQAGEFVVQPRFFLEGSYRTNFFRVDSRSSEPEGVFALHVRPGVALFNPTFDKVAFSAGLDFNVFLPFSGNGQVTDQTNVGGTGTLKIALFPKSAFTLTLNEQFDRQLWMRPQFSLNGNRNTNRAGVDLSFHPGGRALDFTIGYTHKYNFYDDLDVLDNQAHSFKFLASWRFFPLTYAFIESTLDLQGYERSVSEDEALRPGNWVDGMPVKVYAGLSGYITERLALLVRAGYGNTLLDGDVNSDFSSFIGMLQLTYRFSAKTVLHVGAARDFELAALGGHYQFFRAWAGFTQRIGELAEIHADFSYDIRNYGEWTPVATSGSTADAPVASDPERSEDFIRAGLLLDFDISRLFGVTLGYRFEGVISDFSITSGGATNFVGYDDHRVYSSINLRY